MPEPPADPAPVEPDPEVLPGTGPPESKPVESADQDDVIDDEGAPR